MSRPVKPSHLKMSHAKTSKRRAGNNNQNRETKNNVCVYVFVYTILRVDYANNMLICALLYIILLHHLHFIHIIAHITVYSMKQYGFQSN